MQSGEPLNFHWLASESSSTSGRKDPSVTYPLWPFKGAAQYSVPAAGSGSLRSGLGDPVDVLENASSSGSFRESESDSDDDAPLRPTGISTRTSLAKRGPGMSLSQGDINPFDNKEVKERNQRDPWRDFRVGMIVLVQPSDGAAEATTDGFWLGQLAATPEAKSDEERDPDDFYVGVHWWARKRNAAQRKLSWCHWQCKWEPQTGAGGELLIDAVSIDTIGCEVFLNTDGTFKKEALNLSYINYFRDRWFGLSKEEWCKK